MLLLDSSHLTTLRNAMPFLEAGAAARRGCMLGNEHGMPLEWSLFSIVYRLGGCETALDEIRCMLENRRHAFLSQIVELLSTQFEIAAERRSFKSDENLADISHSRELLN